MSRFLPDLRHALRLLIRTPGVTITALLALALAIGANTAMFSVVDAVLIRPLPYADPDRVVMVWEDASRIGFPRNTPAPANWVDWRAQNTVFTDIAASRGWAVTLTGDGPPERVTARRATANLWAVLGTQPALGRTFTEEEEKNDAKVAVIGYGLWQRRFGGERAVLGRKVLMSDEPFTIIGVMPPLFTFPNRRAEIWMPSGFTPSDLARRGSHFLQCVARLKPGVTLERAQAEMRVIAARLEERYPNSNKGIGAVVVPMREQVTGDAGTRLAVLFGASGFVLLVACANIANVLLARASRRHREIAVRTALGAGRGVILRQLLTESLMLAGLGALLGVGLARAGMIALEKLIPWQMADAPLELDLRVLGFTTLAAALTGLLFGIFPALTLLRANLHDALKQGGRGSAGGRRQWMRDSLVVTQTALALALVAGAGLMVQTLYRLQRVDLGLRTDHLLTLSTDLVRGRYPDDAKRQAFYFAVLDRVRGIPGVVEAGYTSSLPLMEIGNTNGYVVEGQTQVEANTQDALFRVVTPHFLQAIGARLREGRFFGDDDRAGSASVVIINETFADRHWRGASALGKRLDITGSRSERTWVTVAGVVKEVRERGINIDTKPAAYMPVTQSAGYWPVPGALVIRTSVDPITILPAARQAIWAVDKDQAISQVRTMEQVVDAHLSLQRQQMTLLAGFGALALVLAATGIYGVISYLVSQRRREIGVRMALGATPADILRTVFRRGMALIGAGAALGILLAWAAAGLLRTLLFGVEPQDAPTLAISAVVLSVVGLAACVAPARAAARVDPAVILHDE